MKDDEIIDCFEKCLEIGRTEWSDIHRAFNDDKKFIQLGEQLTPTEQKKLKGRPLFVVNKLIQYVKQVTNEMRQTNIACQVSPVDNGADVPKAKIRKSVIRAIERVSNATYAYQYAGEEAVTGGMGAFRIITQYVSDKSFDQTIAVRRILDASTVYAGPCIEPDYSDATWFIIEQKRDKFKRNTPEFDNMYVSTTDKNLWGTSEKPYEFEFWYREETPDTLYRLNIGRSVFKSQVKADAPDDIFVMKDGVRLERKTTRKQWCCYKLNAKLVIKKDEWMGKYAPIVIVNGREVFSEGKRTLLSLCRYSKDSQRMYNYARQEMSRRIGLSAKATWLIAVEAIPEKFRSLWERAHELTVGSLPWVSQGKDGKLLPVPSIPQMQPIDPALVQETINSDRELKDTTGIHEASLGAKGNETSGVAINARKREGDTSTYDFQDNLAIAVQHGCRIINDLIPKIIDTPRQIRMVGEDESEEVIQANQDFIDESGEVSKDYYFSDEEEYDIAVSVGPSYATMRLENSEALRELMRVSEPAAMTLPDLYVKSLDFDYADEAADRLKRYLEKTLPPGVIVEEGSENKEMPPEVMQAMEQNKQLQEQMAMMMKEVEQLKSDKEAEFAKIDLQKQEAMAKNDVELHKLEIDQFDADTKRLEVERKITEDIASFKLELENSFQEKLDAVVERFTSLNEHQSNMIDQVEDQNETMDQNEMMNQELE